MQQNYKLCAKGLELLSFCFTQLVAIYYNKTHVCKTNNVGMFHLYAKYFARDT